MDVQFRPLIRIMSNIHSDFLWFSQSLSATRLARSCLLVLDDDPPSLFFWCLSHRDLNAPSSLASSSCGGPHSAIRPASMTIILWLSIIVLSLWAIVSTVLSLKFTLTINESFRLFRCRCLLLPHLILEFWVCVAMRGQCKLAVSVLSKSCRLPLLPLQIVWQVKFLRDLHVHRLQCIPDLTISVHFKGI